MTPLDEMRARTLTAEQVAAWFDAEAERLSGMAEKAYTDGDTSEASRLQDIADDDSATAYRVRVSIRAFRAANREGETKAT